MQIRSPLRLPIRASVLPVLVTATALGVLAIGLGMATPRQAWGKKNGIAASGCEGCHSGGKVPTITLTATPDSAPVGTPATITVGVSQTNGNCAGFWLTTDGTNNGTFKATDSGTQLLGGGVGHTMPRIGTGTGPITFTAQWTATKATGVQFTVYALSCNNSGSTSGDGGGMATLAYVSGCAGTDYYIDQDADGFGTNDTAFPVRKDCSPPINYSTVSGDCNDFDATIHPGAPELCDMKDNNCNGMIDENVVQMKYCEDKDGDGHGIPSGMTKMDCKPSMGFGDCGGDCNDNNATIYPGAPEICDGIDNNCNGSIDEGVRTTCGLGWCRRYAEGCGPTAICMPGTPITETCNLFDDDCDGVIDNGTDESLCGASGMSCVSGRCVAAGSMSSGAGGTTGTVGGTGGNSGGSPIPGTGGRAGAGGSGSPVTGGQGTTGGSAALPGNGSGSGSTTGAAGTGVAETSAGSGGCSMVGGLAPSAETWVFAVSALSFLAFRSSRRRRRTQAR
jgi:hypothetical protein